MQESIISETIEFEVQTDILTLLENVKCQRKNPSGLKQALLALATICSSNTANQDYFLTAGGVEELKTMLFEGSCPLLAVPAALYCLACSVRQNVSSQKVVLSEDMMTVLHELLSHSNSSDIMQHAAAFLLACIVAGSNKGQMLAYETGCLVDLINLFRECMTSVCDDENKWSAIIRAIGFCVNNPQNVHNQKICCSVLPHTLKFITTEPKHKCICDVFSFICLVVANNAPNQARMCKCEGIKTVVEYIKKQVSLQDMPPPLHLLTSAVSALDICIADNEESGALAGTLGLVPILLDLLEIEDLDLSCAQVFILTLAHVLQSGRENCKIVSEGRGCRILFRFLSQYEDEEMFKVIRYILSLCQTTDNVQHNDDQMEENGDHPNNPSGHITSVLKNQLDALSSQLNSIEKLSQNMKWMKSVGTDNNSENPVEKIYPNKSWSLYKLGETSNRTGEINDSEGIRLDDLPLSKNPDNSSDNIVCGRYTFAPPSEVCADSIQEPTSNSLHYSQNRWFTGGQRHECTQSTTMERNINVGGQNFVTSDISAHTSREHPQENYAKSRNISCHDRQYAHSLKLNKKPNFMHSDSEQSRYIADSTACMDVHRSEVHTTSAGDYLHNSLKSYCNSSNRMQYAKNVNSSCDSWSNRKRRQDGTDFQDMPCVGKQKNHLKETVCSKESSHLCQGKTELCQDRKESLTPKENILSLRRDVTCFTLPDCQQNKQIYLEESFSYMNQEKQNAGYVNNIQCPDYSMRDSREFFTSQKTQDPESHTFPYNLNTQTQATHYAAHKAHIISSSESAETYISPYSSSLVLDRPDYPASCFSGEQSGPPTTNSCLNNFREENVTTTTPSKNQYHLIAQMQKVMTSFFQSLITGQTDSVPKHLSTINIENTIPDTEHCNILVQTAGELPYPSVSTCSLSTTDNFLFMREIPQKDVSQTECGHLISDQVTAFSDTEQAVPYQISQSSESQLPGISEETRKVSAQPLHGSESVKQNNGSPEMFASTKTKGSPKPKFNAREVTSLKNVATFEAFLVPIQCPPSASLSKLNQNRKYSCSNISLPSTPQSSPALSQFDSNLSRLAHLNTTGNKNTALFTRCPPINQNADASTRKAKALNTRDTNGNIAAVRTSSVRKDPAIINTTSYDSDNSITFLCPGCAASSDLNSWTYNIAVETNIHTCPYHRNIRLCEREYIHEHLTSKQGFSGKGQVIANINEDVPEDIYDFLSVNKEIFSQRLVLMFDGELASLKSGHSYGWSASRSDSHQKTSRLILQLGKLVSSE